MKSLLDAGYTIQPQSASGRSVYTIMKGSTFDVKLSDLQNYRILSKSTAGGPSSPQGSQWETYTCKGACAASWGDTSETVSGSKGMFKSWTKTEAAQKGQRICRNDVCTLRTTFDSVTESRSEGVLFDTRAVTQNSCTNDVCTLNRHVEKSLSSSSKAGIGAGVSSAISCTIAYSRKADSGTGVEATIGAWAEECVPEVMRSGVSGFVLGLSSKIPMVGPVLPVIMQMSGIIDGCGSGSSQVCQCEIAKVLVIAGPAIGLTAVFPAGGWLASSAWSGVMAANMWSCV